METVNFRSAEFRKDPHQEFRRARDAGPLCRVEPFGFVGVTRYDDVFNILKNPKVFSSSGMEKVFPPIEGAELFTRGSVLISNDPPQHTRVRRLIQKAFTLQEMNLWEPKVEALTRKLVDELTDRSEFDLIDELAIPLPVAVIAEMLGVDFARKLDFKRWSDDMVSVRTVQSSEDGGWRRRREREIADSCREFTSYFDNVIAQRRRDPSGDDLISAMVKASEDEIITPDEVLGLTRLMLVAGNETTTNLLGNAMVALLRYPEQWKKLTRDPSLAGGVVEETLRFDGPVLMLSRRVTEDTTIGGEKVASGTILSPMLASSNRDPKKFENPDVFDITRNPQGHIAFGSGIHLCVGAPLARIETRIALQHLATRFPDLSFGDAQPTWLNTFVLRGLEKLPLKRNLVQMRSPSETIASLR